MFGESDLLNAQGYCSLANLNFVNFRIQGNCRVHVVIDQLGELHCILIRCLGYAKLARISGVTQIAAPVVSTTMSHVSIWGR